LFLTCAAAAAQAGDNPTPAAEPQAAVLSAPQAAPDERQAFMDQQKAARRDFRQKQDQDRGVFNESLQGKNADERKSLREQFHAKQKAERAAFNKDQQEQRRAFHAAHPAQRKNRRRLAADAPKEP
jgi:hypothetical protein